MGDSLMGTSLHGTFAQIVSHEIGTLSDKLRPMPRKPIEIPPAAARAFLKDMRAFHAAKTGLEKDEIAAHQLHALREHLRRDQRLRLTDVHELFLALKNVDKE